jgi:hypothetical protein
MEHIEISTKNREACIHQDVEHRIAYAANQREHHRVRTFQAEYRGLLERHGIECDEQLLSV